MTAPTIAVRELSLRFGSRVILTSCRLIFPLASGFRCWGPAVPENQPAANYRRTGRPPTVRFRPATVARWPLVWPGWGKGSALSVAKRARQRGAWRPPARRARRSARVATLLEQVGLSHCADDRPASLSGGMRQRAALARTLYEDRPIVLMDEPFLRWTPSPARVSRPWQRNC